MGDHILDRERYGLTQFRHHLNQLLEDSIMGYCGALDEKGIVFIDDSGTVEEIIKGVIKSKRWTNPSLERFIYDFLEQIIYILVLNILKTSWQFFNSLLFTQLNAQPSYGS